MNWYREYYFEWKEIVETVAREYGISEIMVDKVREDRMKSKNNPSAQLQYNIPEMLREIIRSKFYESDYKNITQKLLYEDVSYSYAIEHGIAIIAESDVFEYKKN